MPLKQVMKMCMFQVNGKVFNKSALHCAVARNHFSVLKVILEFKPNLEIKVSLQEYLHEYPLCKDYRNGLQHKIHFTFTVGCKLTNVKLVIFHTTYSSKNQPTLIIKAISECAILINHMMTREIAPHVLKNIPHLPHKFVFRCAVELI